MNLFFFLAAMAMYDPHSLEVGVQCLNDWISRKVPDRNYFNKPSLGLTLLIKFLLS